jgi:hypothetical protein
MGLLKRLCSDDPETLSLIDVATKNPDGVHIVNGTEPRPKGNSKSRAIRHLREKRPDIHARVMAREISAHAGMIEAGFRKRTLTIPDDPESIGLRLARHLSVRQPGRRFPALHESATSDRPRPPAPAPAPATPAKQARAPM